MRLSSYEQFQQEELILRDQLAIDRTTLASERTMLAYTRTSLTMFITGLSLIKFFDVLVAQVFGWIFIFLGIIVFLLGGMRYLKLRKNIYKVTTAFQDGK